MISKNLLKIVTLLLLLLFFLECSKGPLEKICKVGRLSYKLRLDNKSSLEMKEQDNNDDSNSHFVFRFFKDSCHYIDAFYREKSDTTPMLYKGPDTLSLNWDNPVNGIKAQFVYEYTDNDDPGWIIIVTFFDNIGEKEQIIFYGFCDSGDSIKTKVPDGVKEFVLSEMNNIKTSQ